MAILNFPPTAGQPTDGSFTYEDNGVLYSWDGYKWEAYSESGLDAKYVEVAGDNMTGDLTLGTDKITLNATDGSINAAGDGNFAGIVKVDRGSSISATAQAFNISRDGTQTFEVNTQGDVKIGGTIPAAPAISLAADGNIIATGANGEIRLSLTDSNGSFYRQTVKDGATGTVFRIRDQSSNEKVGITANGTATFASGNFNVTDDGFTRIKRSVGTSAIGIFPGTNFSDLASISLNTDGTGTFAGNVGIGTDTPSFRLHSHDNSAAQGLFNGWSSVDAVDSSGTILLGNQPSFQGVMEYQGTTSEFVQENTNISGKIIWKINGTEKLRLDPNGASFASTALFASGRTGVVSDEGNMEIYRANPITGASVLRLLSDVGGTKVSLINFMGDGTATFSGTGKFTGSVWAGTNNASNAGNVQLNADGSGSFSGTLTATVVPPSDARFKENITPAKPQLADVVALGGILKNYDWNEDAPLNEELRAVRQLGLIAQEVEEVCPSLVKDINATKTMEITPAVVGPKGKVITEAVTSEVDDSYKGLSQEALIMKLIGAVSEQNALIQALEAEVTTLKGASTADS